MVKLNLFSPIFYQSKINPSLYNKDELYLDLKHNYTLNNSRKVEKDTSDYFPDTDFHVYYKDWDNLNYKKIDFTLLYKQYTRVIEEFLSTIKFNSSVEYQWYTVNINVAKNGFLAEHDHNGLIQEYKDWPHQFSLVHYFSLKPHHSTTTFLNPIGVHTDLGKKLDNSDMDNSSYFQNCNLSMSEDDVIIFPCYIKHRVDASETTTDDLRITVAINIVIKE